MLLLLEINNNRPKKVIVPQEVLAEVDEYINANNYVKLFLDETYIRNDDRKAIVQSKQLLEEFNNWSNERLFPNKFFEQMKINNIQSRMIGGSRFYFGLVLKEQLDDF